MKRLLNVLLVLILFGLVTGCATTSTRVTNYPDGRVVTEELTDDASFNELQKAAIEDHAALMKEPPVVASFTVPGGSVVKIHSQNVPAYPIVRQRKNAFVEGLGIVAHSTPAAIIAGGWGLKQILQNATGDINASDNAQVTTTSNSNNATDISNADGDIDKSNTEDNSAVDDNSNNSDNSDNSTIDSHDQTADPTIVEQPEYNDPVIVKPEVVYPEQGE